MFCETLIFTADINERLTAGSSVAADVDFNKQKMLSNASFIIDEWPNINKHFQYYSAIYSSEKHQNIN